MFPSAPTGYNFCRTPSTITDFKRSGELSILALIYSNKKILVGKYLKTMQNKHCILFSGFVPHIRPLFSFSFCNLSAFKGIKSNGKQNMCVHVT